MATANIGIILCQQCAKGDQSEAELYCLECRQNICIKCFQRHKNIPSLQNHRFRSCTAPVATESEEQGKQLVELFEKNIQKKINNESRAKISDTTSPDERSKILASRSTLEKMLKGLTIDKQSFNVRHIKGSFSQIMQNIKHIKTVDNLTGTPYRLGIVNDKIWIRCGIGESQDVNIAVYDTDLAKVNEIQYDGDKTVATAHQVSETEVLVATASALYVFNIQGTFMYKVLDGNCSDISVNGDVVYVIDCEDNKVIKVTNRDNKWQKCEEFTVNDSDKNTKTIHCINDRVYVCFNFGDKICAYSSEGELLCTFGTGSEGSQVGQFNGPSVCASDEGGDLIVADCLNSRFQIMDQHNRWQEVTLEGIKWPRDVLVVDNFVYILHGPTNEEKVSKYSI